MDAKTSGQPPDEVGAPYPAGGGPLGEERLRLIVDHFYEAVLADESLRGYFDGASMGRLARMQVELFAAALDDRPMFAASQLQEAHARLGLKLEDVSRFFEHLVDTLVALDVEPALIERLVSRLEPYVDDVVGRHGEGG